jgi:TonB-dependent SusC/RagA subfamily outer membrane receptor
MITLAWYLLKVTICSGILCGYYFLALRNKAFHRWNRFYLLAAVLISLIAPVIKINIFQNNKDEGTVVQMLQTISYGDEAVIEYSKNNGFQINTENLAEASYLLVSVIFFIIFFVSLYKIKQMKKKYPETKIEDISFINTNAKGTPFSFFKSIFWNKAIDLHSKSGQQIFNHEIAHVKEKHSHDKIFMNLVLIFFWINPIFWLMRKELYMIHEFIADKEALEDSDVNAFAEMILQTVYPGQNFSTVNSFFYSPLKRRIMMLTKNKNPKVSYYSRLLVLPLAAIVFFAFTLKVKNNNVNFYDGKTIAVVIDAGHGGDDNGAVAPDGTKEKDITLSIAQKIADLNSNSHLKIILSRDNDQTIPVKDRIVFAKDNNADFFISIHVNSSTDRQLNGFSVLVDKQLSNQNLELGSLLIKELTETYKTENKIGVRKNGILVLDKNICPAALVECGFLSNSSDFAFINNNANQEKIAKDILAAINNYAIAKENNESETLSGKSFIKDSIPAATLIFADGKEISKSEMENISPQNIESINVLKDAKAIKKYGERGENGVIEITTKDEGFTILADTFHIDNSSAKLTSGNSILKGKAFYINSKIPDCVLIFADGKQVSEAELKNIPPTNIQSVNILKGETAIKKYGEDGKDGAIEITTKFDIPGNPLIIIDGKESSKQDLNKIPGKRIESINVLKGESAIKKYGDKGKDGSVEIITKKNMSFSSAEDTMPDKVSTKVEVEASFPGGLQAWTKYISRAIADSISKFTDADYGTCVIRFIVNVDGKVSDVIATTMKGTELAKVSVNAIKHGPKWIPASQNGKLVAAYRLQPVTLQEPKEVEPAKVENKSTTEIDEKRDMMISTKLEQTARFPGGQSAWLNYISRVIQKNGNELIADKNSEGTCKVRFIVARDGTVSDVEAVTKQGSKLADVAVNAIENGPRWIPGKRNGHVVNSYLIQPVTFTLNNNNVALKNEPE